MVLVVLISLLVLWAGSNWCSCDRRSCMVHIRSPDVCTRSKSSTKRIATSHSHFTCAVTPQLLIGEVYKYQGEKLEFLFVVFLFPAPLPSSRR